MSAQHSTSAYLIVHAARACKESLERRNKAAKQQFAGKALSAEHTVEAMVREQGEGSRERWERRSVMMQGTIGEQVRWEGSDGDEQRQGRQRAENYECASLRAE